MMRRSRSRKGRAVEEVADADAVDPSHLVAVAGADAAAGGAQAVGGGVGLLGESFFLDVVGEDDVGPVADVEPVAEHDPLRLQAADLVEQGRRVNDDAVADDAVDPRAENAGGDQRELVGDSAGDDGVAGVGASLVADDDVVLVAQAVDDFSLGLVTPLKAHDAGRRHGGISLRKLKASDRKGPRYRVGHGWRQSRGESGQGGGRGSTDVFSSNEVAEVGEQVVAIVGAGGGFRVVLDAEDGQRLVAEAFERAVVEVDVGGFDVGGKGGGVDGEAVVLRGDLDPAGPFVAHRVIGASMAELEFEGGCAEGLAEELVAQADAEDRDAVRTRRRCRSGSRRLRVACSSGRGSPGPLEMKMPSGSLLQDLVGTWQSRAGR